MRMTANWDGWMMSAIVFLLHTYQSIIISYRLINNMYRMFVRYCGVGVLSVCLTKFQ
jgi:hypothetical protein